MSNSDFKDYTGNIRLDNISFDVLHQMFENDKEEYDPADDKRNKFYVGKIGKYVDGSYFYNDYWNAASLHIEFANGYIMTVCAEDVSKSEEYVTLKEFLPEIDGDGDSDNYKPLSQEEKDFADRVIMQLITANAHADILDQMSLSTIMNKGLELAILRTKRYKLHYWRSDDDEE